MMFDWKKMLSIEPEEITAGRILADEVGALEAMRIGVRLRTAEMRGEPFVELPEPVDEDERLSRAQIGPAILLYRELRERHGPREAYRITERSVVEATLVFLGRTIGTLDRGEIEAMDDEEQQSYVREIGRKFFNATLDWGEISGERVEFTVTHCHFPDLCEACGVPELAPVFCAGDAEFFGGVEPGVELERPTTIARGGEHCAFTIRWAERES
jgi:hypothetical protein